ncbi:DUF3466 family protein [Shewanella dokdonensis]|uniref:DUF3466 family protein n=1 Tax=Shewanella dokdonensis TaxID=712036 RepID=UPI00200CAF6E|nr:DUF3466 family protein [Shewanella dokdonensis]MCL1076065.1 DUF3466 family protein [Shewanella dokdonensis]
MKLNSTLSLVALSVVSVLQVAHAASVYEIVNIENADVKGTLTDTANGYGQSINANNELVGVSRGRTNLSSSDVNDDSNIINLDDAIGADQSISYSTVSQIIGNSFAFHALENDATTPWLPTFESINSSIAPSSITSDNRNTVDSYFFDINDAGIRVGAMSAPEKTMDYAGSVSGVDNWYYRDYELRGFVKSSASATEMELPPPYTEYTNSDNVTVNVGGSSLAAAINSNNLIAGYGSVALSSYGESVTDSCISSDSESSPVDICIQANQFPNSSTGVINIQYKTRAMVWQYHTDGSFIRTELPLGLDPGSSSSTFVAQGLGINDNGVVVGRSHVYRNGNTDDLYYDAAYWSKNGSGSYEYHWIPVIDNDVLSSIAYSVNAAGIVVGSYKKYIDGYQRDKFFIYDSNTPDTKPITPNDFYSYTSDLSSRAKDINNQGQVVGYIETSEDKQISRPKDAFLYDVNSEEFSDLNNLLTCESKGYQKNSEGKWVKHQFTVTDATGNSLTYDADIRVVEANKINDEGVIAATAFVRKPVYQTDLSGNLILDGSGNPTFKLDGEGHPVTSYLPRMVVLKPAATSATACDLSSDGGIDTGSYSRKGAAVWGWLLLLPLAWLRRRQ